MFNKHQVLHLLLLFKYNLKVIYIYIFNILTSILFFFIIAITDKASKDDILLKDAIYSTIGLGANNFSEFIDFDSWFINNLLPEGLNKSPK